jgi:PAS domain-containing protein
MEDRRRLPPPTDTDGYLRQLTALALLNRLPTAMLGVDVDGAIAYANPAIAELLGYEDGSAVARLRLPELLTGHEAHAPTDCLNTLRSTASIVEWNHSQNYVIQTMLSRPLLLRDTDRLLLIGITDITAWLWETKRSADLRAREDLENEPDGLA